MGLTMSVAVEHFIPHREEQQPEIVHVCPCCRDVIPPFGECPNCGAEPIWYLDDERDEL